MAIRLGFVLLIVCTAASGQTTSAPSSDPLGRSTPRGTVINFLRAAHEGNYRRATEYLESPAKRQSAAEQLANVLDRAASIDIHRISDIADGDLSDAADPDLERIGTVRTGKQSLDLVLRRANVRGVRVWLFSASTLDEIPRMAADLTPNWLETALPDSIAGREFLGVEIWRLVAMALLLPIAAGIAWFAAFVVLRAASAISRRTPFSGDDAIVALLNGPLRLFIAVLVFHAGILFIGFPLLLRGRIAQAELVVAVFAVCWFLLRLVDFASGQARHALVRTHRAGAVSILPLGRRIVKVSVLIVGVLAVLDNAGFDLKAVLTGLGVGGIAIALAAQRTLENVFGGLAIVLDQPVRVGDFCKFGDSVGTVEDIGLRSTRIRTLDRTVISVPNGQFSTVSLENFGPREKVWFHPVLRLRLDSTTDQVRYVLREIGSLLTAHEKLEKGARIRLIGLAPDALNLEVFAYVSTADYDEFLAIQEDLLFRMMRIVEEAGTSLALPTRTAFLSRDRGIDRERAAAITNTGRGGADQA